MWIFRDLELPSTTMHKLPSCLLAVIVTTSFAVAQDVIVQDPADTSQNTIIVDQETARLLEVIDGQGSYRQFTNLVKAANLIETLEGDGPFTIFAPSDAAVEALGTETLAYLIEPGNKEKLKKVLSYHIIPGIYPLSEIESGKYETAAGEPLVILRDGDVVAVAGAQVITPDTDAANGVVHGIDKVLIPAE